MALSDFSKLFIVQLGPVTALFTTTSYTFSPNLLSIFVCDIELLNVRHPATLSPLSLLSAIDLLLPSMVAWSAFLGDRKVYVYATGLNKCSCLLITATSDAIFSAVFFNVSSNGGKRFSSNKDSSQMLSYFGAWYTCLEESGEWEGRALPCLDGDVLHTTWALTIVCCSSLY